MMKKKMNTCLMILLMILAGYLLISPYIEEKHRKEIQPQLADKTIRFHIIANSDSKEDQNLKLLVRDEIGKSINEILKTATNKEESENLLQLHLLDIKALAQKAVEKYGYEYEVDVRLHKNYFPEKIYDQYVFPEGEYDALEIVLGEGRGHNYWCVLFPQMCFNDTVYEAKDQLRKVLSREEYEAVLMSGNYEVRLKLLEMLP